MSEAAADIAEAGDVDAGDSLSLLAVVAEDRVSASLYRTGQAFVLETLLWPAMWGTRNFFSRYLTPDEARTWLAAHGIDGVTL